MALSKSVVAEDRKLVETSEKAGVALMKLRWHWTLDESNDRRVSFAEYARQVGRNESTIRQSARGYSLMVESEKSVGVPRITPDDAKRRANASAEKEAAVGAVADQRGIEYASADRGHQSEIKLVLEAARDRAESQGTSVEEEAPIVAKRMAKSESIRAKERADLAKSPVLGDLTAGVQLSKAKKALRQVLNIARDVEEFDEDSVDHIQDGVEQVRSVCDLIDLALTGHAEIDWDGELAKLAD